MLAAEDPGPESLARARTQGDRHRHSDGRKRRTAGRHWLVFAQHTDRRLPASHSVFVEPRVAVVVVDRVSEPRADRLGAVVAGGHLGDAVAGVGLVGLAQLDRRHGPPVVRLRARHLHRTGHRRPGGADQPLVVRTLHQALHVGREGEQLLGLVAAADDVAAVPTGTLVPRLLRRPEPRPGQDGPHRQALVGTQQLHEARRALLERERAQLVGVVVGVLQLVGQRPDGVRHRGVLSRSSRPPGWRCSARRCRQQSRSRQAPSSGASTASTWAGSTPAGRSSVQPPTTSASAAAHEGGTRRGAADGSRGAILGRAARPACRRARTPPRAARRPGRRGPRAPARPAARAVPRRWSAPSAPRRWCRSGRARTGRRASCPTRRLVRPAAEPSSPRAPPASRKMVSKKCFSAPLM